jgi:MoxR-like ATPase
MSTTTLAIALAAAVVIGVAVGMSDRAIAVMYSLVAWASLAGAAYVVYLIVMLLANG